MKGENSNLLTKVRDSIKQEKIPKKQLSFVNQCIYHLDHLQLNQLFSAIEMLLCFIPDNAYQEYLTIEQLAQAVNKP